MTMIFIQLEMFGSLNLKNNNNENNEIKLPLSVRINPAAFGELPSEI